MPSHSPALGHATHKHAQKTTSRTVAQRKVYGKRRNNAPRAVFEQKSPAKEIGAAAKRTDDIVEAIQTKLAEVTLTEEVLPSTDVNTHRPESIPNDDTSCTQSEQLSAWMQSNPQEYDSSNPPISSGTSSAKSKNYEQLVEVRIRPSEDNLASFESNAPQKTPLKGRRAQRKNRPTARRSSGLIHDIKAGAYVRPILNEALSTIASQSIQKFSTWASRSATMFHVAKLAEGSYGEVYKLHLREETCRPAVSKSKLAKLKAYGDGVFKVVPLRAQSGPGSKKFTSIEEIVSEVKMLKYLDPIPGFARFREIHVVQGRFPESFQGAWDHYKKTKNDCLNPNPSSKKAYPDTQLWAIVEMDDAGCELEKFSWSSIFQIYDIFWGVAMALARAEEYALFEHRDLHLGNVCIRSTRPDGSMAPPSDTEITRQSSPSGFGISSLETTIIDYSLSRAELCPANLTDDRESIVETASSDLDKKQIFGAVGRDEDEILLRNTYRYMRNTLYTGNPVETEKTPDIPGIWAEYAPRTNLVWLLFILKNLLKDRKAETVESPVSKTTPSRCPLAPCSPNKLMDRQCGKGKPMKQDGALALLKVRHGRDLSLQISQLKQTLEDRLKSVLELLDLEHGHEDMCCAADLVAYAMDSQWLAEQDFF